VVDDDHAGEKAQRRWNVLLDCAVMERERERERVRMGSFLWKLTNYNIYIF